MKKEQWKELEEYCLTHSKTEVLRKYGSYGVYLMYLFHFPHPRKYRTKGVRTQMIIDDLKSGKRQCDIAHKFNMTRQQVSQIAEKYKGEIENVD